MRLLYLDEAGTDHRSPVVVVSGVLVHGDRHYRAIDDYMDALIWRHVEPEKREDFIFHATDIYHGSGYFDRRKPEWADAKSRNDLLTNLAAIVVNLGLSVVVGRYYRGRHDNGMRPESTAGERTNLLQQMAAFDCLSQADKWLTAHAPDELATVVHEDGSRAKNLIKRTVRVVRSPTQMASLPEDVKHAFSLPLRRIVDTVHFAEKQDARPLQLADLCAFLLCRFAADKHVPMSPIHMLLRHVTWVDDPSLNPANAVGPSS